jgi:undecaprenyl-diphosphatase
MMDMLYAFDFAVLDWIQQNLAGGLSDSVMVFITKLGDAGLIWILIGCGMLAVKKYRPYGVLVLLALIMAFLLGDQVIKHIVERVRPCNAVDGMELLIQRPHGYSFPSGHTGSSFAAATVVFAANRKFGIAAFCLAGLIAFSRLYLYVHFPTDVLAGMVLGVLVGISLCFGYKKLNEKRKNAE